MREEEQEVIALSSASKKLNYRVPSNRVVGMWNDLPDAVVSAASTNQLKNLLGTYQISKL